MAKHISRNIKSNIYKRWHSMKRRCENPNEISYKHYGDRGIGVCEDWQDFLNFYSWSLANGYSDELQIDRIDNEKGYSPENCRWVTARENSFNKSNSVLVEMDGKEFRFPELAEETGIKEDVLRSRYKRGDRGEHLIRPIRNYSRDYSVNPSTKKTKLTNARDWLKKIRLESGLKQYEVAEISGLSKSVYSHIETGQRGLSTNSAKAIAETLDFDWKKFFEETLANQNFESREKVLSKA